MTKTIGALQPDCPGLPGGRNTGLLGRPVVMMIDQMDHLCIVQSPSMPLPFLHACHPGRFLGFPPLLYPAVLESDRDPNGGGPLA